ncbi:MAG: SAM hydroxide adenosyltransferase, partial [Cyanobacteria bacterium P01_H01_bin.121]
CAVSAWQPTATGAIGYIQHCDRFGNAITNLPADLVTAGVIAGIPDDEIKANKLRSPNLWSLTVQEQQIAGCSTYASVAPGQLVALLGSHGWLEIAINQGSATQQLGLKVGMPVQLIRA